MNKKIAVIVGVLVIAVVIASLGCIGDIDGGGSAKEVAKILSEDAGGLMYLDIQTIRVDKDLEDLYEELEDEFKDFDIRVEYGSVCPIDIDDVNYIVEAGRIEIVGGKFDLEDIRDELDNRDFDEDDYKGVELWIGGHVWSGGHEEAVAISKDELIIGREDEVKDCIKVMKGDRTSLYDDDEDIRDVLNKLPDGIMTYAVSTGTYEDSRAMGFALTKVDDDTLKIKGVVKFDDEYDAEDAKRDLEDDLEDDDDFDDVKVKQKGEFVEFTANIDIEYMLKIL
jgi:hypothetical protein